METCFYTLYSWNSINGTPSKFFGHTFERYIVLYADALIHFPIIEVFLRQGRKRDLFCIVQEVRKWEISNSSESTTNKYLRQIRRDLCKGYWYMFAPVVEEFQKTIRRGISRSQALDMVYLYVRIIALVWLVYRYLRARRQRRRFYCTGKA